LSKGSSGSGVISRPWNIERCGTIDAFEDLFDSGIGSIVSVENAMADSALLVDIAVVDGCNEAHLGRLSGEGVRESNVESVHSSEIGSIFWP
jgi:hypothetical protein